MLYNVANVELSSGTLYLDKVKVGDAAQMTASLGASYEVLKRVTFDGNYNLDASISPNNFSKTDNKGSLELPSYGLMNVGFSDKMLVGARKYKSVNFRINVNNTFR